MGRLGLERRTVATATSIRKPPPTGIDKLPKDSRDKLMQLLSDATDARDRHTDQSKKLNDLVARLAYQGDQPDEQLAVMVQRARDSQAKAREADIMWRDLSARLTNFVDGLAYLRVERYEPATLRRVKASSLKQQVAEVREQIESITFEIRKAKAAPATRAERASKAERFLAELAAEGVPSLVVSKDNAPVELYLGEGRGRLSPELAGPRRIVGACVALVGVTKALAIMMPQQPEAPGALTAEQRKVRAQGLQSKLLDAERAEEALIEQAAADGQTILRRSNADPRAVLNIVVHTPER